MKFHKIVVKHTSGAQQRQANLHLANIREASINLYNGICRLVN